MAESKRTFNLASVPLPQEEEEAEWSDSTPALTTPAQETSSYQQYAWGNTLFLYKSFPLFLNLNSRGAFYATSFTGFDSQMIFLVFLALCWFIFILEHLSSILRNSLHSCSSRNVSKSKDDRCLHLDFLLSKKCGLDLLDMRVYPNGKEISEAVGCFQSHRRFLPKDANLSPDYIALVIGDGATPRLGLLCSFVSKWQAISVDPNLQSRWVERESQIKGISGSTYTLQRFVAKRETWETFSESPFFRNVLVQRDKTLVIFCPHAHVKALAVWNRLVTHRDQRGVNLKQIWLCFLPCCTRDVFFHTEFLHPKVDYEDVHIFSPHRRFRIYQFPL